MDTSHSLIEFVLEWACYLTRKRHRVSLEGASPPVLSSDAQSGGYRWLLFHAERTSRRLTGIEREHIVREYETARRAGQQAYVVIKFVAPLSKVVALPAETALTRGSVSADKGGIPWED
jgi:hypothetical protein